MGNVVEEFAEADFGYVADVVVDVALVERVYSSRKQTVA